MLIYVYQCNNCGLRLDAKEAQGWTFIVIRDEMAKEPADRETHHYCPKQECRAVADKKREDFDATAFDERNRELPRR